MAKKGRVHNSQWQNKTRPQITKTNNKGDNKCI